MRCNKATWSACWRCSATTQVVDAAPADQVRRSDASGDVLAGRRFWGPELHLLPTRANGQPAFAYYLPDLDTGVVAANGLMVLSVVGQSIDRLTRFGGADLVERFGLPATLSL